MGIESNDLQAGLTAERLLQGLLITASDVKNMPDAEFRAESLISTHEGIVADANAHHGQMSGSEESLVERGAKAAKSAQSSKFDTEEKEAKKHFEDMMFFAALYLDGDLDTHIARSIVDDMSDADVNAAFAMIEESTGMSMEEYAQSVLGEKMIYPFPNESEMDYKRRLLIAITDEVLEDDLSIAPGFENDIWAQKVAENEHRQQGLEAVAETRRLEQEIGVEKTAIFVRGAAGDSYYKAEALAVGLDTDETVEVAVDARETHRDGAIEEASLIASSTDFISGFPGGSALPAASQELQNQFGRASPPTTETHDDVDATPSPVSVNDLG